MKTKDQVSKTENAKFGSNMIIEENPVMPVEGDIYVADFDIDKLDGAENPPSVNSLDTKTANQDYLDCFGFDKLDDSGLDTGSEASNSLGSLEDNVIVDSPDVVNPGFETNEDEKTISLKSETIEEDFETAQAVDNIPKATVDITPKVDNVNKKIVVVYRVDLNKTKSSEPFSKARSLLSNKYYKLDAVNDSEVAVKTEVDLPVCGKCLFIKNVKNGKLLVLLLAPPILVATSLIMRVSRPVAWRTENS